MYHFHFLLATSVFLSLLRGCGLTDVDPPPTLGPPLNVGITSVSSSSIRIHWQSHSEATGYRIERAVEDGAYMTVGTTGGTSWADTTLHSVHRYSYRVLSLRRGDVSKPSLALAVKYDSTNKLLRTVTIGWGWMKRTLSPDGSLFASGSQVWRTTDWSILLRPNVDTVKGVESMAFSGDSRHLVVGGAKGWAAFRTSDGALVRAATSDTVMLRAIAVDPTRSEVIVSEPDTLRAWNFLDGRLLWSMAAGPEAYWSSLSVSADGRLLAATAQAGAKVWDLTSRIVRYAEQGAHSAPTFNHSGSVLSWSDLGRTSNYNTADWTPLSRIEGSSQATAFLPGDTCQLVAAGNLIHIVHLPEGSIRRTLAVHTSEVTFLGVLEDGRSFISGDGSQILNVWSTNSEVGWVVVP